MRPQCGADKRGGRSVPDTSQLKIKRITGLCRVGRKDMGTSEGFSHRSLPPRKSPTLAPANTKSLDRSALGEDVCSMIELTKLADIVRNAAKSPSAYLTTSDADQVYIVRQGAYLHRQSQLPQVASTILGSEFQSAPILFGFENQRDACLYATYVARASRDNFAPSVHQASAGELLDYAKDYGLVFFVIPSGSTDIIGVEPSKYIRCSSQQSAYPAKDQDNPANPSRQLRRLQTIRPQPSVRMLPVAPSPFEKPLETASECVELPGDRLRNLMPSVDLQVSAYPDTVHVVVAGGASSTEGDIFDCICTVCSREDGHMVRTVVAFIDASDAAQYASQLGISVQYSTPQVTSMEWAAVEEWCDKQGLRFQLEPRGTKLRPADDGQYVTNHTYRRTVENCDPKNVQTPQQIEVPVASMSASLSSDSSATSVDVPQVYSDLSFNEIRHRLRDLLRSNDSTEM